jgi:hypothetical protein
MNKTKSKPENAPRQEAGGDCHARLVSRFYGRECDNDRKRMLEMALRDLWRNYPEWPSTFGPCHNHDCNGSGRGSGLCAQCVTDCIAEIVGMNGPAESMKRAVEDARMTASKLREMVFPANADVMARGDNATPTTPKPQ